MEQPAACKAAEQQRDSAVDARMQAPYIGEETQDQQLTQVQKGFINLEDIVSDIQEAADLLSDRLYPVLRAKSTEAAKAEKTPPGEIIVPLAEDLRSLCDKTEAANEDLRSILSRLEI